MNWCFAIINKGLAEIYFEKENGIIKFLGHCYVNIEEFKSKREKIWIRKDTEKMRFRYKDGNYNRL